MTKRHRSILERNSMDKRDFTDFVILARTYRQNRWDLEWFSTQKQWLTRFWLDSFAKSSRLKIFSLIKESHFSYLPTINTVQNVSVPSAVTRLDGIISVGTCWWGCGRLLRICDTGDQPIGKRVTQVVKMATGINIQWVRFVRKLPSLSASQHVLLKVFEKKASITPRGESL